MSNPACDRDIEITRGGGGCGGGARGENYFSWIPLLIFPSYAWVTLKHLMSKTRLVRECAMLSIIAHSRETETSTC